MVEYLRITHLLFTLLAVLNAQDPNSDDCNVQGMAPKCGTPFKVGLTNNEKAYLIDYHNKLRNKVATGQETDGSPGPQPTASNMQTVGWNDQVADRAQLWAEQCVFKHDQCRNEATGFSVGQNIDLTSAWPIDTSKTDYTDDLESHMLSWYGEVKKFSNSAIDNFSFDESTGHYTQLVWADTYIIGCGYVNYNDNDWRTGFLVCNYYPPGNVGGGTMYNQEGSPASNCPEGTSSDSEYPGLCS